MQVRQAKISHHTIVSGADESVNVGDGRLAFLRAGVVLFKPHGLTMTLHNVANSRLIKKVQSLCYLVSAKSVIVQIEKHVPLSPTLIPGSHKIILLLHVLITSALKDPLSHPNKHYVISN